MTKLRRLLECCSQKQRYVVRIVGLIDLVVIRFHPGFNTSHGLSGIGSSSYPVRASPHSTAIWHRSPYCYFSRLKAVAM